MFLLKSALKSGIRTQVRRRKPLVQILFVLQSEGVPNLSCP
jgi:hypothetical protein